MLRTKLRVFPNVQFAQSIQVRFLCNYLLTLLNLYPALHQIFALYEHSTRVWLKDNATGVTITFENSNINHSDVGSVKLRIDYTM